jgi:hypothetical protein
MDGTTPRVPVVTISEWPTISPELGIGTAKVAVEKRHSRSHSGFDE